MVENKNLSESELKKKISKELLENLHNYRKSLKYLSADAPIQTLCLEPIVEKILLRNGFFRIYDIIDVDFSKIEGLNNSRIRNLTTRLNEFLSVF